MQYIDQPISTCSPVISTDRSHSVSMVLDDTRMNRKQTFSNSVEYCLTLSDGSSWWLSEYDDHTGLVDRLAAIMELKKSSLNGSPKLIFSQNKSSDNGKCGVDRFVTAKLNSCGRMTGWAIDDPASFRVWYDESIPDVLCEVIHHDQVPEIQFLNMWYAIQPIYQRSICRGGLPLHAGLVELAGRGVLLVASSDKGKSTCCRRLPDNWNPLCDDEALVILDKQKKYRVHPFPTWSDYLLKRAKNTWNVQYSVPLYGVFFLEQSETDEVIPAGKGQAAVLLSESSSQICQKFWRTLDIEDQRLFRNELFNNACDMAKHIPAYHLSVSRHGRFWEKIEQVLGL